MRIAVLGAGSWGTTVASLVAPRHDTVLWARNADVAKSINVDHANAAYLPGFDLPPELSATASLDEAVCEADLLVVGVPTSGFRAVLEQAHPRASGRGSRWSVCPRGSSGARISA